MEEDPDDVHLPGPTGSVPTESATGANARRVSPRTQRVLRKLVHLQEDQLDLSIVEKVMISQDGVISLCNDFVAGSAGQGEGRAWVDFDALNQRAVHVVGLYGSKGILLQIFEQLGLEIGEGRGLETGIYGVLGWPVLYIFYWHPHERMGEASRNNPACNFVRYVVDLCDIVYVCLDDMDDEDLKASLATASTSSHPKIAAPKRTGKYTISGGAVSLKDFQLREGFRIQPELLLVEGNVAVTYFSQDGSGCIAGELRFLLSEGLHRSAVLIPSLHPPEMERSQQELVVKVQELPDLVTQWSKAYSLSFDDLPDEEFIILLLSGKVNPRLADDYRALVGSFESRRFDHKQKFYSLEESLREEEQVLQKLIERALHAYQRIDFQWEERTFDPRSWPVEEVDNHLELLRVEQELCKLWTNRTDDEAGFLFVGSEFWVLDPETDEPIQIRGFGPAAFVVDSVNNASSKWAGPVLLSDVFVGRLKQDGSSDSRCWTVQVLPNDGGHPEGPVIATRTLTTKIRLKHGRHPLLMDENEYPQEVRIRLQDRTSIGMLKWMRMYGKETVLPLLRRADVLSYMFEYWDEFALEVSSAVARSVMTTAKSASPSAHFRSEFPNEKIAKMLGKLNLEGQRLSHSPNVIEACRAVYLEDCKTLSVRVESTVRKDIIPLLREHRRRQLDQQGRSLEECFKQEESNFARTQKSRVDGDNPGLPKLSISKCSFLHSRKMAGRLSSSKRLLPFKGADEDDEKLVLQTFQEETERTQVTWSIAELAPTKEDVAVSPRDAAHTIVPRLSLHYKLIDLDLSLEKLSKVITMRSGAILLFVEDMEKSSLQVYLCPRLGVDVTGTKPIKTFRRFNLYAFDELSSYMALYDQTLDKVGIYKYDESSRHINWCDIELPLAEYSGSKDLTCIHFIPGKKEMLIIDTDCRVRVFEITRSGMIKPRALSLPGPPSKVCVTSDGTCLLALFVGGSASDHARSSPFVNQEGCQNMIQGRVKVEVYNLEEDFSHLKTFELDLSVVAGATLDAAVIKFESQTHLLLVDTANPSMGVVSKLVVNGCKGPEIQEIRQPRGAKARSADGLSPLPMRSRNCGALDYLGHIFAKFATSPPLMKRARDVVIHILLGGESDELKTDYVHKGQCIKYVQTLLEGVGQARGKRFSDMHIHLRSDTMVKYLGFANHLVGSMDTPAMRVGTWIRQIVCLVPIHIVRGENNSLRALSDGIQLPANVNYSDAVTLASVIRFGLYDAVLSHWQGNIKVISSMGKQSSGKSYLLNHLSGSLLDVAGGRCTDGVWMTTRATDTCLFVLLDFEGIGSFERSDQEDMLLSLLNAALSNITIFNKKDFFLDKETEAVFQRFQNGMNLVKQDSRLFQGLFYLAIKDVHTNDVEDLKDEFFGKILQMCSKSDENFVTKMYGGQIVIAAMPPFQHSDFHDSVVDIAMTVEDLKPTYTSGNELATDFKLLIAQLSAKDWSPINSKRMSLRIDMLIGHLSTAVCCGKLQGDGDRLLVNLDTLQAVADEPIQLCDYTFTGKDSNLELFPCKDAQVMGSILQALKRTFVSIVPRTGTDEDNWHAKFEAYLKALARRREFRVLAWLQCNTDDYQNEVEVQHLRQQAVAMLAELTQSLSLCSSKCSHCFLRCGLERSHPHGHDCLENSHRCPRPCTFCPVDRATPHNFNECRDLNGHDGPHDCKDRKHVCGQDCRFSARSSNCNGACSLLPNHGGDHSCNTTRHLCVEMCSLPSCNNTCDFPLELGHHERHACSERMCPQDCSFNGCTRKCGSQDHFHDLALSCRHVCLHEHTCHFDCEAPGICQVVTELARHAKTFAGRRSVFQYEHVTEQAAVRHKCSIAIPPGKESHDGPHRHTDKADAVHFCENRCTACGYFCHLPMGHPGLHDTTHGNMRDLSFVAEVEDIDIQGRKYTWGESGKAELCMMYCKAQGRGHVHLVKCRQAFGKCAESLYNGVRHERRKYGPNFDEPKDEFSHAAYWKNMRFKDPCQPEDQGEFELCNHFCRSEDHASHSERKYCTEKLWHLPVQNSTPGSGYVTEDGHAFPCTHETVKAHHIIFIIDISGSMVSGDIMPTLASISRTHNNRLGCVYEAVVRFVSSRTSLQPKPADFVSVILFNSLGSTPVDREHIAGFTVDGLLAHVPTGWTDYSSGLLLAKTVLQEAAKDKLMRHKSPMIVFLSDGADYGTKNPLSIIQEMKQLEPDLVMHTILFSKDDVVGLQLLKNMAAAAGGTFNMSIDEVQLAKSFEVLAHSLRPSVISLM